MRYENEGLADVTSGFKQNPGSYLPVQTEADFQYITSDRFAFAVEPAQIAAGSGSYTIRIRGAENADVELQYRYNEGPLAYITIHLDAQGETSFFVSSQTRPGTYRFVGMRTGKDAPWNRLDGRVQVTR
jgi:hypothetical protein